MVLVTRGNSKKRSIGRTIGLLLVVISVLIIFLPTVIFLTIAMVPTLVALMVDKDSRRYGGMTVGGLNFSGAAPYLLTLWMGDHSVRQALTLLSDVFALITMFGSAAFGWMLYTATPSVVATVLIMTSGRRLAALKARQGQLRDEWGPEVVGLSDDEDRAAPPTKQAKGPG